MPLVLRYNQSDESLTDHIGFTSQVYTVLRKLPDEISDIKYIYSA